MRTIEYGNTSQHVPAFLTKLWKLVTDTSCDDLISWSLAGTSFIIYDEIRFAKELLPMYFKHNNMASFVRQLNMYGFRKLSCIDQGGMHCYKNEIEFYHQYFIKGQESLLELIKRKIPTSKSEDPKVKQEYIDELVSNIKTLRGKQDSAEQGMRHLKRENRILWRHVNLLTERSSKQQSVLQQLMPYFMTMVRSNRELALKRKPPLMIGEGESDTKVARVSPPYFVHEQDSNQGMPNPPGNITNRGPIIHEVTETDGCGGVNGIMFRPTNKECEAIINRTHSLESSNPIVQSPTMETLNILNQSYESRSRSNSFNSQMSTSSVSSCNMQIQSPGPSNFSESLRIIPSAIIIDEATCELPGSEELMPGFVPNIDIAHSDSGIYTLDAEQMTSFINQNAQILNENSSTAMLNPPSDLVSCPPDMAGANSLCRPDVSSLMNSGVPASMIDSELHRLNSSNIINNGMPPLMNIAGTSILTNSKGSPIIINAAAGSQMMLNANAGSAAMMNAVSRSPPIANAEESLQMANTAIGSPTLLNEVGSPTLMNAAAGSPTLMHTTTGSSTMMHTAASSPTMLYSTAGSPTMMHSAASSSIMMNASAGSPNILSAALSPTMMSQTGGPSAMLNAVGAPSVLMNSTAGSAILMNAAAGSSPMINDAVSQHALPVVSEAVFQNEGPLPVVTGGSSSAIAAENTLVNSRLPLMKRMSLSALNTRRISRMSVEAQSLLDSGSAQMIASTSAIDANLASANFMQQDPRANVQELSWVVDQQRSTEAASEPNIDKWLGQIFKADNLTAGCSLPQPQEGSNNMNFA